MECYGVAMVLVTAFQFISTVESATSVFDTVCSFETDLCGWTALNLTRTQYPTVLAARSGPKQAEDGDFYVYLDTHKQSTGSLTRNELMAGSADTCLRFWYHMFGETMGSLTVFIDDNEVWSLYGNQSDTWHCAAVNIAELQSKISFEAIMGRDIYSIIALDNIEALKTECIQENCENLHSSTTVKSETSQPTTSQPTTTTQSGVTTSVTSTQINLQEYIPIIAGVPAAILVIGAVILVVCLRKQKLTKIPEPEFVYPNQYDDLPHDPYTLPGPIDEEYADLDEMRMINVSNPHDEADSRPVSGHTNPVAGDYEEPDRPKQLSVGHQGNQGGPAQEDYITPIGKRSDVTSAVYATGDDEYITPTYSEHDGPRKMSIQTAPEDIKVMHRASITSAGAKVDDDDYLVMTTTKGKKGGTELALSLTESRSERFKNF